MSAEPAPPVPVIVLTGFWGSGKTTLLQRAVGPVQRLDAWPSDDRRTRLVAITYGLEPAKIRDVFDALTTPQKERSGRRLALLGAALAFAMVVAAVLLVMRSAIQL